MMGVSRIFFSLLVGLVVYLPASGWAQGVRFGVHIDPAVRWLSTDNQRFQNAGIRMGLNAGLDAEFMFAERYSLATGVNYDLSGGTLRYTQEGYSLKTTYEGTHAVSPGSVVTARAHFLNIPLGVKLRAIEIGYVTLFATVGLDTYLRLYEDASCTVPPLKQERTEGMYKLGYLGYLIRLGAEYSLGGNSSIEGGLSFNGALTPAYNAGMGQTRLYGVLLRVGFVF